MSKRKHTNSKLININLESTFVTPSNSCFLSYRNAFSISKNLLYKNNFILKHCRHLHNEKQHKLINISPYKFEIDEKDFLQWFKKVSLKKSKSAFIFLSQQF